MCTGKNNAAEGSTSIHSQPISNAVLPNIAARGGFLTGWLGQGVCALGALLLGVLITTGILGSLNSRPTLQEADARFINARSNDFGARLYPECITNFTTYVDGPWQYVLPDKKTSLALTDLAGLRAAGVYVPDDPSFVGYRYEPETACMAACNAQLGLSCTVFTYDGISEDSCRFLKPGGVLPEPKLVRTPHRYLYNATCILNVRIAVIAAYNEPAPGLKRPTAKDAAAVDSTLSGWGLDYWDAAAKSLRFLRAQWAGKLPTDYDIAWRKPGFVAACNGMGDGGAFAGGDHVVSTMATAESTGVLALGQLWWADTWAKAAFAADNALIAEIVRSATWLSKTWNNATGQVLVGVGDQLESQTGKLLAYEDFGTADAALKVGEPSKKFGQATTVAPQCTYTTPEKPSAEVAAHAAAALALAGHVSRNHSAVDGKMHQADWTLKAQKLLDYSMKAAPIGRPGTGTDFAKRLGASQLYPISSANNVQAHQLWAACALYQTTGQTRYWAMTKALYQNMGEDAGGRRLYWPIANYDNPLWYGLMCVAQSSATYNGLEQNVNVDLRGLGNMTTEEVIKNAVPEEASRLDATQQLWGNLLSAWLDYGERAPVQLTDSGLLRYPEGTAPGLFRDAANVAMLALMYADLPSVTPQRAQWSRCLAKQTVDYILGKNTNNWSYMVGFGSNAPSNPYSKDAACPPESVREARFTQVYEPRGIRQSYSTRECDYLTFLGNATADPDAPGGVLNPVLDNTYELTGALVARFDVATETYKDERILADKTINPHAQIGVDFQTGLTNALAGLAALPPSFFADGCPVPEAIKAEFQGVQSGQAVAAPAA